MIKQQKYYILAIMLFIFSLQAIGQTVVINEVMASNSSVITDENGDYSDWVELFNASSAAVNLNGYGLSDDPENPYRWTFPNITIQAGGYMIIWASGKDRQTPGSALHTNFSINTFGEEILLTHPAGNIIDNVAATYIPADVSFGRRPDGSSGWYFFNEPSPGTPNSGNTFAGVIPPLSFSDTGGFYAAGFNLSINTPVEGATIYYTLDGSVPGSESTTYTGPVALGSRAGTPNDLSLIPTNDNNDPGPPYYEGWQPPAGEVFKTNVIRAVAMKDNYLPSQVATQNYLIDPSGANRYSLPVFFMNTDRANLFDPETGIYFPGNHNNMYQRGMEWERPMHLTFYERGGTFAFSGDYGFRLHGGTTRSRPRKSLRIYARDEYGDAWINYQLFPEKDIHRFKRFLLRNSGNDWDQSVFRDGFMQYLARDMEVETHYYRPSILFINGEYWGIHNIRDRYDEHYIFSHYGLEEHEMVVIQNNGSVAYGNPDGLGHYLNMRSFIAGNSLTSESNYEYVQTLMDVESFADFQIAEIYIMNTDWPGNNTNIFRRITTYDPGAPKGLDGRWRWMILDTDFGFGLNFFYVPGVEEGPAHNTLAMALDPNMPDNHWPNPPWSTFLLRKLVTNTGFKHHFINRFADMLNTTFREENVVAVLDSIEAVLAPEMPEHINRWRRPVSMAEWRNNVQRMRVFGLYRALSVRQHIKDYFHLDGMANVVLNASDAYMGSIRVNTVTPEVGNRWTGIYFLGIPVEVEAKPRLGYRFSHWSGTYSGNAAILKFTPEGNIQLTAHFEPDPAYTSDELNPGVYNLSQGPYYFNSWDEDMPEGTYPAHMLFLQSNVDDPGLEDKMTHRYHIPEGEYHLDDLDLAGFPYKLTGRTRLNGLGADGISFINTGRGRDLGAAVLAIDTRGLGDISVEWTGGTLEPGARVYAIRLQYKTGFDGVFKDVTDGAGQPVEYFRSSVAGHQQRVGPVILPPEAENNAYVQLRWKYYYTGEQVAADHGRRDMLRLDDIEVTGGEFRNELILNVKMKKWADHYKLFDPSADYVDVAGTFNGWDGINHMLSRVEGDSDNTYTIAIPDLEPGSTYEFKFRINGSWEDGMHEFPNGGPNRVITMHGGKNVYSFWFNDEYYDDTAMQEISPTQFRVYPNPANEVLNIESNGEVREVRLINFAGQVVITLKPAEMQEIVRMPVSGFAAGLYLLQVITDEGIASEKIIVRHK